MSTLLYNVRAEINPTEWIISEELTSAAGSGGINPARLCNLHGGETLGGGWVDTDEGVKVLLGGSHLEGYTKPLGHLTSVGA